MLAYTGGALFALTDQTGSLTTALDTRSYPVEAEQPPCPIILKSHANKMQVQVFVPQSECRAAGEPFLPTVSPLLGYRLLGHTSQVSASSDLLQMSPGAYRGYSLAEGCFSPGSRYSCAPLSALTSTSFSSGANWSASKWFGSSTPKQNTSPFS